MIELLAIMVTIMLFLLLIPMAVLALIVIIIYFEKIQIGKHIDIKTKGKKYMFKYMNKAEILGNIGEKQILYILQNIKGNKKIITNCMLNDQGKTRQIDHILINTKGVFVIEVKNYTGSIYGLENSKEWKQYLGNNVYKLYNPIHQNYAHCEVVRSLIPREYVIPVIVFTQKANLKVKTTRSIVIKENDLKSLIENRVDIISEENIEKIYGKITNEIITDEERIRNHNFNVQHYVAYKERMKKQ